jgi:hypothetical protein
MIGLAEGQELQVALESSTANSYRQASQFVTLPVTPKAAW